MENNYLVSNFGEYMDVVMNGKVIALGGDTVTQGKMVRTLTYIYDGKIYTVNKLNDDVIYCIRLA